jgi:hypothetical protein
MQQRVEGRGTAESVELSKNWEIFGRMEEVTRKSE